MSAEAHHTSSPPSSGRSSPVPRAARRTIEDVIYKADKSLKRYGAAIERALSSWEISPEEWADYIAFLSRLLKAIQTHPKDAPILPHSSDIATRLAQCLNPALPSGVHQKALEVFNYIFDTFGNDHVAAHLHEYLPGLSAVLSFASLTVRPGVYTLLEEHIVLLPSSDLRPALKSLILGLLPALEEENGEDFERALNILQTIESTFIPDPDSDKASPDSGGYFWQCLFLAVVTSPSRRQGALNFFTRRLPRLNSKSNSSNGDVSELAASIAAKSIVSPEPGLLIRCFVCGLSDPQVLIQRGFLDLLVTHMPLNSDVLQAKVGNDDLYRLVSAATQVLLRRDMSLNRRLWSWFLGPELKDTSVTNRESSPGYERKTSREPRANTQLQYFSTYGQASLERCILKMFQARSGNPVEKARPFRVCTSLMDRWEIGGFLVPQLFLPAMQSLYEYKSKASASDVVEVLRSASLFFDGVEASLIWESLIGVLHTAFEKHQPMEPALGLLRWVIQTFNVREADMQTRHIPLASLYLLGTLDLTTMTLETCRQIVELVLLLLDFVAPNAFEAPDGSVNKTNSANHPPAEANIQQHIIDFYHNEEQVSGKIAPPFSGQRILILLASKAISIIEQAYDALSSDLFSKSCSLLLTLMSRTTDLRPLELSKLRNFLLKHLGTSIQARATLPFQILSSLVASMTFLYAKSSEFENSRTSDMLVLEPAVSSQIWRYLSPELPKFHVEAVKLFWLLEDLVQPEDTLIGSLLQLVRNGSDTRITTNRAPAEATRHFAVLWVHSVPASPPKLGPGRRTSGMSVLMDTKQQGRSLRVLAQPLFLVLDKLNNPEDPAFEAINSWLHGSSSLDQILQMLFSHLDDLGTVSGQAQEPAPRHRHRTREGGVQNIDYILSHFHSILTHGNLWTWQCLAQMPVSNSTDHENANGLSSLARYCMNLLCSDLHASKQLNRRLISILDLLISSPVAAELKPLELDVDLLNRLTICIASDMNGLQGSLLALVQRALKLRMTNNNVVPSTESRRTGSISLKQPPVFLTARPTTSASSIHLPIVPPQQLFKCLRMGFSSKSARHHLDHWLAFLAAVLPLFPDAIFTNLLPLVECFCAGLTKTHEEMLTLSQKTDRRGDIVAPESVAMSLLDGLEMVLDKGYECLVNETATELTTKENEPKAGFLSNVTSGVFRADGAVGRTTKSNNRLTVILALQDSIRVALKMWLWSSSPSETSEFDSGSSATTAYNALKVRNKTRHLLEQIYSVELLESLEVVIAFWGDATTDLQARAALSLLHVMPVSRPKNVVPATLDALCSRTNSSTIPASRNSSLTLDLSPSDVAMFFSAYLDSAEDDAIDEIWPDCVAFLRDVLANPLPYRQVLPHFLSIILLLSEKLNNTNFGEQRKMRRDLGDIFQRLLTATLTTLPSGYVAETAMDNGENALSRHAIIERNMTLVPVLNRVTGKLDLILETSERVVAAINNITASLVAPTLRARSFPKNITHNVLNLITQMTRKAPTAKAWKKEISDAFNDSKILSSSVDLMTSGWFPVLHQWSLYDKERMPEILLRLLPPSTAGIMFGVGASAARLEADRRTQLNIRRICILLLASPEDTYVAHLRMIEEKLAELFEASSSSSPSFAIKADLFLLCRTLALSTSSFHLSPLWPIINSKLQRALVSLLPGDEHKEEFSNMSLLQACKLLDLLVALSPEEFQLHEWLYITDTIDAVYQPAAFTPTALADEVAAALGSASPKNENDLVTPTTTSNNAFGKRRLLLGEDLGVDREDIKALPKDEFVGVVLKPFVNQLSLQAYEGVYSMESPDLETLKRGLLVDVLDIGSAAE